jgi:hypothetical protein
MPELTLVEPGGVQPKAAANALPVPPSAAPAATSASFPAAPAPFGGALVLPTKRAFEILHVSKTKGFALIKADILKTVRIGRSRLVTTESLLHVIHHGVSVEQLAENAPSYLHRDKERKPRGARNKRVAKAKPMIGRPLQ